MSQGRGEARKQGPQGLAMMREWKTELERRAPLLPDTVAALARRGHRVQVEASPVRVFEDAAYAAAGADLRPELEDANLFLGIKEVPLERLRPGRAHLFFSHTIKGQAYNRPLLDRCLEAEVTLLDHELVTEARGRRLIFFGVQAGQAGAINTLWTIGQRLAALGEQTPLAELRQAREYGSLAEACWDLRARARAHVAAGGRPLVIGTTGGGNVTRGALEVLRHLDPQLVTPEELAAGEGKAPFVVTSFADRHYADARDGSAFKTADYRAHPERYRNAFHRWLPHLDVLVTGHTWFPEYPPLLTQEGLAEHLGGPDARLLVVGDVTCDPGGSIACTVRATLPDDPSYVWHPQSGETTSGFAGEGLAVMAVDILPTELAREASQTFDGFLSPWLEALLACDWTQRFEDLDLPAPFRRAIITHQGKLTPASAHLAGSG